MVKLTKDADWQEVEIANFYDPERHHTVRVEGYTKKLKYYAMKMDDGRIYDKEQERWLVIVPEVKNIVFTHPTKLPLPYKENSVEVIKLDGVLERCEDTVELIKEIHRVLLPSGRVKAEIPYAPSHLAFSDPETKNYFNDATLNHFVKGNRYDLFCGYNCDVRGEVMHITLKK